MHLLFVGLLLVAFHVECDGAQGDPVPAENEESKYERVKRQVACGSSPCQNGGVCSDRPGGFVCFCPAGFTGLTCDQAIDACAGNPCLNGGTCTNQPGGFVCACPAGFTGLTCNSVVIDRCASDPCLNGGTCSNRPGGFDCTCLPAYTGATCDMDVNECLAPVNPCSNGGTCVNLVGGFTCICPSGFTGPICDTAIDPCAMRPCLNGGTCSNQPGGFVCACAAGFTGQVCQTAINACASNPCLNGGTCTNQPGGFMCACPAGFTGPTCQTVVTPSPPAPKPVCTAQEMMESLSCSVYKLLGFCDSSSPAIITLVQRCNLTCGVCQPPPPTTAPPPVTTPSPPTPPPVCTPEEMAESISCPAYKQLGLCDSSDPMTLAFMRQACNRTCGICQPPPTMPPVTTATPTVALTTAPPGTPTPEAACLTAHNDKRALHGSSPLTWNDELAQDAQSWANQLASTGTFEHDPDNDDGENLYLRSGAVGTCVDAVDAWYTEEPLYNYNQPPQTIQEFNDGGYGHFTQIVWKSTTMVGAAVATMGANTYVVARYSPAGNVIGQFAANVMQPMIPSK